MAPLVAIYLLWGVWFLSWIAARKSFRMAVFQYQQRDIAR